MTWQKLIWKNAIFQSKGFFSQKNSLFIERARFKPNEPGLLLYESKEKPFFILFSICFAGSLMLFSYKAYSDYQNMEESNANLAMSAFLLGALVISQWKINKSVKNIYLHIGGKGSIIEVYRFGGIYSEALQIENKYLKGAGLLYPSILKSYKVPVIHWKTEKKKGYFFFKSQFVKELEILKNTIIGKEFLVSDEQALNMKISKKSKNAYKL